MREHGGKNNKHKRGCSELKNSSAKHCSAKISCDLAMSNTLTSEYTHITFFNFPKKLRLDFKIQELH